jgi:hypothetical protein
MKLWYASAPGNHRHKCCDCGQVWEHSDDHNGSFESHTCPTCWREPASPWDTNLHKYLGPDTACIKVDAKIAPDAEPVTFDGNDPEIKAYVRQFNEMCRAS